MPPHLTAKVEEGPGAPRGIIASQPPPMDVGHIQMYQSVGVAAVDEQGKKRSRVAEPSGLDKKQN